MTENSFHNLLMTCQSVFHKKVFANLSPTNLTSGQPKILDYLKNHDGCVQKELATNCQIEPATVTSLLLRMEEKGLIERKSLNGNRRSLYVFLTPEGRRMLKKVEQVFETLEAIAFQGFTVQEKQSFLESFSRIYSNLCE